MSQHSTGKLMNTDADKHNLHVNYLVDIFATILNRQIACDPTASTHTPDCTEDHVHKVPTTAFTGTLLAGKNHWQGNQP